MEFKDCFQVWNKLSDADRRLIEQHLVLRSAPKGTLLHRGSADCLGFLVIKSGQLRGYINSEEGRELTIYRLFERDICVLAASCIMNSIQFEIFIEAEKDTEFWLIPPDILKTLMESSAPAANYTTEIMSARLSETMWLIEQVMWRSMDKRIASFLLEEASIEGTNLLKITHESIANHLGTHREVVTRMLRYFQGEGMVLLSRGTVEIKDEKKLTQLQNA